MLDQAGADHSPLVGNDTETLDLRIALEEGDREVGAGGIGADEGVENLDGAGRQHGRQGLDGEGNAVAGNPASEASA